MVNSSRVNLLHLHNVINNPFRPFAPPTAPSTAHGISMDCLLVIYPVLFWKHISRTRALSEMSFRKWLTLTFVVAGSVTRVSNCDSIPLEVQKKNKSCRTYLALCFVHGRHRLPLGEVLCPDLTSDGRE